MLSCPPCRYFPAPRASLTRAHSQKDPSRASSSSHAPPELSPRSHNSKSASLLRRHLSSPSAADDDRLRRQMPPEERARLLELSLVRRRTPQFPGSIYAQSPADADVASSLPPIRQLLDRGGGEDENALIVKAIEIRRRVTAEILKEAMMRKGKFGITYASNVVENLGEFLDYVMVEAAALKRFPDFADSSFNLRAKAVIDDCKVVPLIRWLKHNSLSYPQIGKLICKTKGNLESITDLAGWLKTVHVKGEFIGSVMLKSGDHVLESREEERNEIVEYLERNGVRREWTGYVLSRCPQLLSFTMEELTTRVGFFFDMGMNEKDFGTMVFDYPRILGFFSLAEMNEKVNYLKEFGLSNEEVGKLLAFKPQLMGCSIEERWKPLVKYMYYHGIDRDGMRRILFIKPMIFCVDLEMTIVPKVKFFQDIGIRDDAIGKMLVKFPPLLTYSLFKKIRPVVIFLITKAGVKRENIGKVIALGPELLGCNIAHKLEHNVKYFLSLGIRVWLLGEMIADFPMLLRYNPDVLRPKYTYLRRTMIRPLRDLIEFPRFLSYSLERRIIPRHKILVENRITMRLRYMLASTDEEFHKRVEDINKKRRRFESGTATTEFSDPEIDGDLSLEDRTMVDLA